MNLILWLIGSIVVIKFFVRNRRMFMERTAFWLAVKELRKAICEGFTYDYRNKKLDDVIESVTEGGVMSEELDLQEDVARIIKRIKQAKENDELKSKAESLIAKIKAEL